MKKLLFLLATVLLTFTSCIKGDDSLEKRKPLIPGAQIYNCAVNQNMISMQQANVAMRLAILQAEAKKQNHDDLNTVEVSKINVKRKLFGQDATLEDLTNGVYKISFTGNYTGDMDNLARSGAYLIDTKGISLEETTYDNQWKVTLPDGAFMKFSSLDGISGTITVLRHTAGTTKLYSSDSNTYTIEYTNIIAAFDGAKVSSDRSGIFEVEPPKAGLSYSDCAGKDFMMSGDSFGPTFYTFSSTSETYGNPIIYSLTDGIYRNALLIIGGVEESTLQGTYNTVDYPSSYVKAEWSLIGNQLKRTITYNGMSMDM